MPFLVLGGGRGVSGVSEESREWEREGGGEAYFHLAAGHYLVFSALVDEAHRWKIGIPPRELNSLPGEAK